MKTLIKILSIFIFIAFVALTNGCDKGNNRAYSSYIPDDQFGKDDPSLNVVEIAGEALIRSDDIEVDDRTRIAALLDALRKFALKKKVSVDTSTTPSDTTIKCIAEWDGLRVSSETHVKSGVVKSDEIEVILRNTDNLELIKSWRSRNMKLVEPARNRNSYLSVLLDAMKERGFNPEGNHRLEDNIWREIVRYRNWDTSGEEGNHNLQDTVITENR